MMVHHQLDQWGIFFVQSHSCSKKNRRSQYGKRTYLLHSCHVPLLERFDLTTSNLQGYTVIIIDLLEKISTRFHQPKLCSRPRPQKCHDFPKCLSSWTTTKPKRDLLRKMRFFIVVSGLTILRQIAGIYWPHLTWPWELKSTWSVKTWKKS